MVYRPCPTKTKTKKYNQLQMSSQRQHFLLSYLKAASQAPQDQCEGKPTEI